MGIHQREIPHILPLGLCFEGMLSPQQPLSSFADYAPAPGSLRPISARSSRGSGPPDLVACWRASSIVDKGCEPKSILRRDEALGEGVMRDE